MLPLATMVAENIALVLYFHNVKRVRVVRSLYKIEIATNYLPYGFGKVNCDTHGK